MGAAEAALPEVQEGKNFNTDAIETRPEHPFLNPVPDATFLSGKVLWEITLDEEPAVAPVVELHQRATTSCREGFEVMHLDRWDSAHLVAALPGLEGQGRVFVIEEIIVGNVVKGGEYLGCGKE